VLFQRSAPDSASSATTRNVSTVSGSARKIEDAPTAIVGNDPVRYELAVLKM